MFALRKFLHDLAIALSGFFSRFLPDRSPVTLVGSGAAGDLCAALARTGVRRCLIVTDRGLVELGMIPRIAETLAAEGVEAFVYDGVQPDPTFTQVEEGLARLRSERCEAVLAIGGGSPMDAAKVIAAMATNDKPMARLEGLLKVRKPTLPLFAIPTTAGTGSEATIAAVVSDPVSHAKKFFIDPKLIPSMAALDPDLMLGLPPHITAATGMDALTHAVESYLAPTSTAQTEAYATIAVRLVFAHLAQAFRDGNDAAARKGMALASYYAGMAFTRTGVGYVHAIAHNLGATYGTPHGWANAVVLPQILDYSADAARARLAALADILGLEGRGESEKAAAFIQAVRNLMAEVAIPPTLPALQAADIPSLAERALAEAHANYPVPRYMNRADCEALIARLLA
jgi:alcohol dehydrogenase